MTDAARTVSEFCGLMARHNAGLLRPYLAEDVVYQNVGMRPNVGAEATVANLAAQFERFGDAYEYRVQHLVAEGDVVLTERLDMVRLADGSLAGVPVMGAFVVRDGVIQRWTDYWDSALVARMHAGEDFTELVPAWY